MANKALFLDRDGTINVDTGYVYRAEDFMFIDGIVDLCRAAIKNEYRIIVATNQSGIARGYYTMADFEAVTAYMKALFKKEDIDITDVFFCPELSGPDRKPASGMFLKARDKYLLDMAACVSVGDKERDVAAAANAGVGRNFLFQTNHDAKEKTQATAIVKSLTEIIPFLTVK